MEDNTPKKESIAEVLKKYKEATKGKEGQNTVQPNYPPELPSPNKIAADSIPKIPHFDPQNFQSTMSKETDPDLMTSYEIIKLPSGGIFYPSKIAEVSVEYMTSKDEDLLTTPSLIENGSVLDVLLKRKIKTPGITPEELIAGDRNAVILFLRTSSYGPEYTVTVPDPRTGIPFKTTVDLMKLKYKEMTELPNEFGYFHVDIPMRKKTVYFRLLSSGEDNMIFKNAQAIQEAYVQPVNEYNTLKLKAEIVAINDKTDRSYIDKFVNAMPALDSYTIRKKVLEVAPDVDMAYEFSAKDGYKFTAYLSVGADFFFPNT
jgi:hypothetical protein